MAELLDHHRLPYGRVGAMCVENRSNTKVAARRMWGAVLDAQRKSG
jgi:hypothetical protein